MLADEHQFLSAITALRVPLLKDRRSALRVLRPVRLGHETPPAPGEAMTHHAASLGPAAGFLGPAGLPDAGGDAVFLGFRYMLAAQFLQPARGAGGALEVEQAGVEDGLEVDLAHDHRHDPRVGVEAAQDGAQLFALVAADQVDLAQENHVGEFNLIDQQVADRALVVFTQGFAARGEAFGGLVVTQEVEAVDDGDHGVEPGHFRQTATLLIAEGEARRPDLFQQVLAQGAADAAVAHFHQFFFGAIEADVALHLGGVDIDHAHVVDDYRDPQVVAIAQHMVEHRALAGTKEAGQHGYGKTIGHGAVPHQGGKVHSSDA
ncbi:hypothetical protein L1887_51789 [Cichorium endivia]|nr:hypothetical protein L1887_51789 [Cichorium endivia]